MSRLERLEKACYEDKTKIEGGMDINEIKQNLANMFPDRTEDIFNAYRRSKVVELCKSLLKPKAKKAKYTSQSKRCAAIKGLKNKDNSCYMDSVIMALFLSGGRFPIERILNVNIKNNIL